MVQVVRSMGGNLRVWGGNEVIWWPGPPGYTAWTLFLPQTNLYWSKEIYTLCVSHNVWKISHEVTKTKDFKLVSFPCTRFWTIDWKCNMYAHLPIFCQNFALWLSQLLTGTTWTFPQVHVLSYQFMDFCFWSTCVSPEVTLISLTRAIRW